FVSLWVSGSLGVFETAVFVGIMLLAWTTEDSRWQISERLGTVLIVLALPIYYLLWRYRFFHFASPDAMLPGILARLILSLTAIKLLQRKSPRDWMFLYVMSFFELLLGAGLSISIGYFLSFAAYVFVMVCTIMMFEVRKTDKQTSLNSTSGKTSDNLKRLGNISIRRFLSASVILLLLIAAVGVPTFFMLPRVGGAGLLGDSGGVATFSGFSDIVKLGGIGRIQQNDEIVMRVRIDGQPPEDIHWRGVALDTFDGRSWSRSKAAIKEPRTPNDRDLIQVNAARRQDGFTMQTVYLEPLDTPVIFGLNRMIGIQGNFPILFRDVQGSVTYERQRERVSYRVISDTEVAAPESLQNDLEPYSSDAANYLQLPLKLDSRIFDLAEQVTAGTTNRFDASRAVEAYLQTKFGYTLEQKAGGGDPLSDFLFNVREGHCEYFAAAMAVMLRTQGIATRVVNGFQRGDYNDAADVYVVRQRNAHSWVEVYFPESESWVTFDPTPFAGQTSESAIAGFANSFRKYADALETFWIQYFVAFDNQEQRSLFVSVRRGLVDYQSGVSSAWDVLQKDISTWWSKARGDEGLNSSVAAIGRGALAILAFVLGLLLLVWLYRKVVKLKVWRVLWDRFFRSRHTSIIEFYDRMIFILSEKGFTRQPHQTPLEFAFEVGIPEAVNITEKYNRVRFGEMSLNEDESVQIENWLDELEIDKPKHGDNME
ncbi:MAG: transglutaminaseTgpA domain-containing protein, partial [Pyrinomonadaceae bacterium]